MRGLRVAKAPRNSPAVFSATAGAVSRKDLLIVRNPSKFRVHEQNRWDRSWDDQFAGGAVDSGIPYVIADCDGRRLTPSVIYYPPNAAPVVGEKAARVRALEPERTIYSIKRFM